MINFFYSNSMSLNKELWDLRTLNRHEMIFWSIMPGGFIKTFFLSRKVDVNSLGTINGLLYLKFIKFSKIKFIKPLKNPNTSIDLFLKNDV